ncbi:MAG: hypothetical protein P8Y97_16290 [Candidatus Lokiarchaeota archaeon]
MFNENSCQKCGTCLNGCPYLHLSEKDAKIEIKRLVNTRLTLLCSNRFNRNAYIRRISKNWRD